MRRIVLMLVCLTIGWTSFADEPTKTDMAVMEMAKRYQNVEGVDSEIFVKGDGLELVKMMLRKEFGKEFMKGVTSIVIIDYGEASEATSAAIRKEMDAFTSLLEEFDLAGKKEISGDGYARGFARKTQAEKLSDFLFLMEDGDDKMVMYMGGDIIVEE